MAAIASASTPPQQAGGPVPAGPHPPPGPPSALRSLREAGFFFRYLKPVWKYVTGIVLFSLLASLLNLPYIGLPIVLVAHFSEQRAPQTGGSAILADWFVSWFGREQFLIPYLVFTLACMLLANAALFVRTFCSSVAGEHLLRALRSDVFGRVKALTMRSIYAHGSGRFVQHVTRDIYQIRNLFGETLTETVEWLLRVGVYIGFLFYLEPVLTGVLLLFTLWLVPAIRFVNRRVESLANRIRALGEDIVNELVEVVGGYRDLRASGRFQAMADRFEHTIAESQRVGRRTTLWAQSSGVLMGVTTGIILLVPYFLFARDLNARNLGVLLAYVALWGQVFPLLRTLAFSATDLAMATPALSAVRGILAEREEEGDSPSASRSADRIPGPDRREEERRIGSESRPTEEKGKTVGSESQPARAGMEVEFQGVGVNMEGRWILRDLNFIIPGRCLTAIVGQSGSGKTTIFHLLLRLIQPDEGRISVDGRPLESLEEDELRRLIGFIPQNPFIFNQSIRENLLAPQSADAAAFERAVRLAQLTELVEGRRHEGGLDALAGLGGMRLSAGERQRVALARLVLQDPQIIVCDEYTANIDIRTARLIQEMMRSEFGDRTRLVISHELYTIRGASRIIVLDRGRADHQGSHEELLETSPLYRTFWETQRLE